MVAKRVNSTKTAAWKASHDERTSALDSGSFSCPCSALPLALGSHFTRGLCPVAFPCSWVSCLPSGNCPPCSRRLCSLWWQDGGEGSEVATHPLLRRSQSYIPPSAAKPPAGPPPLKSGFCVKQGNVVSAGEGPGAAAPRGLGVLQGCSGCRTSTESGRAEHRAISFSSPEEELEAAVLRSG